jgi:hypothetical protein
MELIILGFDMLLETFPVDRSSTNVGCGGVFGRMNVRAVNDLLRIHREEFISEGMTDMFSKTDHVTELFGSGAGVGGVFVLGIELMPERKPKKDANLDSVRRRMLRLTVSPVRSWSGMDQPSDSFAVRFTTNQHEA